MVIEKVQGDEPTKYVNSKTSGEFYQQGLHKKQRSFSCAVDHLVSSQVKCNEEDDDPTISYKFSIIKFYLLHPLQVK